MRYEYHNPTLQSIFGYTDHIHQDATQFSVKEGIVQFIWNRNEQCVPLQVDELRLDLQANQIITTTFFQKVQFLENPLPLTAIVFNKPFYCLIDHDSEIGCNGILFFGTQDIPII